MGLRDLFDSDPRSKKELRQELAQLRAALVEAQRQLELRPEDLDERKRSLDREEVRIKSKDAEMGLRDKNTALLRLTLTLAAKALKDSKADISRREQSATQREIAVSARENAQQVQLVNLTRREQEMAVREGKVTERERLEKEVLVLRGEVSTLRSRQKELLDDAKHLGQALHATREEGRKRAEELRGLREVLERAFLLRVSSTKVLHWLAGLHAQEVQQALGETPVTVGSGPWDDLVFDATLESAGFVPQLLDEEASSFEVFVVGEIGVDVDALAAAVQERLDQGAPVRLYSQELWLLHLMTGCDPLAMDESVLIEIFARSHEILGAFVNEEWNWPSLGHRTEPPPPPPPERGASPLHAFGYRAGKRTDAASRRAKLEEFFECRRLAPYFDESQQDLAYRNSWGRPGSSARLRRMVHHIRWLIGFQGASADKAEANRNWNDDLAWIRKVLAPRAGVRSDVASP